jgi:hypothetical protein
MCRLRRVVASAPHGEAGMSTNTGARRPGQAPAYAAIAAAVLAGGFGAWWLWLDPASMLGAGALSLSAVLLLVAGGLSRAAADGQLREEQERLDELARNLGDDATDTRALWEFSRQTLRAYMDRNMRQLRLVFTVSVVVMVAGFGLLAFGSYLAFTEGADVGAVSAVSGVLVEYMGASLLRLYFSSVTQAERYVRVLERINAVQMALGVIARMSEAGGRPDDALHAVASGLLEMFKVPEPAPAPATPPVLEA